MVHGVPPFPYVRESLETLQDEADVIVVSPTPGEALVREWEEHDIARYARVIAGQEMGTKSEHLALRRQGQVPARPHADDRRRARRHKAARANDALFFPINPGHEDESLGALLQRGLWPVPGRQYAGAYEAGLIAEFERLLPEMPALEEVGRCRRMVIGKGPRDRVCSPSTQVARAAATQGAGRSAPTCGASACW